MSDLYALVDKTNATVELLRGSRISVLQQMEAKIAWSLGDTNNIKSRLRDVAKSGDDHLRFFIEGQSNHATWGGFRLQAVTITECK